MLKRVLIILGFILCATLALFMIFIMTNAYKKAEIVPLSSNSDAQKVEDSLHKYSASDLNEKCEVEDVVFCAIEKTVKCTLNPELSYCNKKDIPSFILGKTEENVRPTEISFSITKIKPLPESRDISVYTKSDCNASWFGLCKGTVIYSLTPKDGEWVVNNIFALEE